MFHKILDKFFFGNFFKLLSDMIYPNMNCSYGEFAIKQNFLK